MSQVGAVIVTYNSASTLPAAVASLRCNGITDMVVVDNNSRDATARVAHELAVRYLPLTTNQGFAAAGNQGARHLTNPWLLFLNPDAVLADGARPTIERYLTTFPRVGVVGLLLCQPTGEPERFSFGPPVTLWSLVTRRQQPGKLRQPHPCGWVSAGAMVVRRRVFEALGGFDVNFFLYWEDVDFCQRVRDAGWQVVLLPTVKVWHRRGASLNDQLVKTVLYDAAADRYFRKHYAYTIWWLQRYLRRGYRLFSPLVQ